MKNLIITFIFASFIPLSFADTEIYVRGTGNVKAAPDVGLVNFAVTTSNMDAMKAQTENAKIAQNVINKLKSDFKIEDKDIQTSGINVGPRYSYPSGSNRKFEGFEVNNSLTIRTKNLNDLGKLLDILVKNGVNNIQNISFDIDDKRPLIIKALELAYEDAKEKAEVLAKKSGKKLGKLKHLNEYYGQSMSPMPRVGLRHKLWIQHRFRQARRQ
jgi:uncharacterized protein YggE